MSPCLLQFALEPIKARRHRFDALLIAFGVKQLERDQAQFDVNDGVVADRKSFEIEHGVFSHRRRGRRNVLIHHLAAGEVSSKRFGREKAGPIYPVSLIGIVQILESNASVCSIKILPASFGYFNRIKKTLGNARQRVVSVDKSLRRN